MRGRHLLSAILYILFGWIFQFSIRRVDSIIEVKKRFLWLFTVGEDSIDMREDAISFIETEWHSFKTLHLIVNGYSWYIKPDVETRIKEILTESDISLAPLICSQDSKEPEYVLQIGRTRVYRVDGPSWKCKEVSYNVADLGSRMNYLLVNSTPIAVQDSNWENKYITILKDKGCNRDPFIISPVKQKSKLSNISRYPYLLLGAKHCYQDLLELKIEDIVYFDFHQNGEVHFGTGVDFYYPKLKLEEIAGIKECFISKGAELHSNGETFTTRVTYRISTWFKDKRQSVTLGPRGVFYTRTEKKMQKTSFIPYHDFYFINPIGWRFWGRRLQVYGSQNIDTRHTFKNRDYKIILEKIYSFNPALKTATGRAYRAFSWNPFKKKPFVIIGDGMLIHGHPKRKARVALEGKDIKDSKKYGRFYHFFRDVVIDTQPSNIRYDEGAASVQIKDAKEEKDKSYREQRERNNIEEKERRRIEEREGSLSTGSERNDILEKERAEKKEKAIRKKVKEFEKYIYGTKIERDDSWLIFTTNPLFATHLWFTTAKKLMEAVNSVKGKESTYRREYRESSQAKEDLRKRREQMAEFARKPSLIQFLSELRYKTNCDTTVEENIVTGHQVNQNVSEEPQESNIESFVESTQVASTQLPEGSNPPMPRDIECPSTTVDGLASNIESDASGNQHNTSISLLTPKKIALFFAGLCLLAFIIIIGIKLVFGSSNDKETSVKYENVALEEDGSRDYSIGGIVAEGEILDDENAMNIHPDGYDFSEEETAKLRGSAEKFLSDFYSNILPTNNKSWDEAALVNRYFTPEFAGLYRNIQRKDDGEMGYFDYDLFTHSQDPDYDRFEIVDFSPFQDGNKMGASVTLSLISKVYPEDIFLVILVQEKGHWMIRDYNQELEGMKEYLSM